MLCLWLDIVHQSLKHLPQMNPKSVNLHDIWRSLQFFQINAGFPQICGKYRSHHDTHTVKNPVLLCYLDNSSTFRKTKPSSCITNSEKIRSMHVQPQQSQKPSEKS